MPDQHLPDTLMNRRKGGLQFRKDAVSERMLRQKFLVPLFREPCNYRTIVVNVEQYAFFLETVDQPHIITSSRCNCKCGGNRIGSSIKDLSFAVRQRGHYRHDLVVQQTGEQRHVHVGGRNVADEAEIHLLYRTAYRAYQVAVSARHA